MLVIRHMRAERSTRGLSWPGPRRVLRKRCAQIAILLLILLSGQSSRAYSVLTHEQIVDLLWHDTLRPMLLARYPDATVDDLRKAHAYAYGGSLIQDIGYYPFGSHLFSDLVHYVRSGDFVIYLLSESQNLNEYAFALGALAHYASDTAGHPAVNASVALDFPKLHAKYGDLVTYEDNPKAHIRTEFGFDVAQVAKGRFTSDAYHDFIGFEVARPVLERAFLRTYGLPLTDVLADPDRSIGSFRRSVSTFIPVLTKVAIQMKKDEILHDDPTMTKARFMYHMSKAQYEREWGKEYQKPGFGTQLLAFLIKIVPHIGPLSTLDVKVPSQATETLYMKSVIESSNHYASDLAKVTGGGLVLENRDFDTGRETTAGEYALTDETYSDLLEKLAANKFAELNPELQSNILNFYRDAKPPVFAVKHRDKWAATLADLEKIKAWSPSVPTQTASVDSLSCNPSPCVQAQ